ncbi:MAG: type II secretion system protein [Crocosphaera sp.]|nr:type II secretion system protein [Crocosphaera sp.]
MSAVSNPHQGLTLMEVGIVVVISGIIAGMGIPHVLALLHGDEVQQGVDNIQLALQDAQKQAIRHAKSCTIVINPQPQLQGNGQADNIYVKDSEAHDGCLGSVERKIPAKATIESNFPNNEISFSFKGNTTSAGTILVKPKQGIGETKCLVMGVGLGIIRTGIVKPEEEDKANPKCEQLIEN